MTKQWPIAIAMLSIAGCAGDPSGSAEQLFVALHGELTTECGSCHANADADDGADYQSMHSPSASYDEIMAYESPVDDLPLVGNSPATSKLTLHGAHSGPAMSEPLREKVETWITQQALEDGTASDQAYSGLVFPSPTCTLSINPTIGDTSTRFAVSVNSAYSTICRWSIDNGVLTSGPCQGPMYLGPFGGGARRVEVFPEGPGGFGYCLLWFHVQSSIPAPTAQVTISPRSGTTQTPFTFNLSATNADQCYYALDSSGWVPVPCNITHTASGFSAGTHTVWMKASGPEQEAIIDTSFTVTAPAPTCTISATPTSGTSGTAFAFALQSTGATSCWYQLDGGAWNALPCTYQTSAAGFSPGTHTLAVRASNSVGTGTCTGSIQVF